MSSLAAWPRRYEALTIIAEHIERHGYSPSYDEIGRALKSSKAPCGVSVARVRQLVDQLTHEGLLSRSPGAQRKLRLRDPARCRALLTRAVTLAELPSFDELHGGVAEE